MRVSTLYKPPPNGREAERVPLARAVVWIAMALVLLGGIALYFMFARGVTPLL